MRRRHVSGEQLRRYYEQGDPKRHGNNNENHPEDRPWVWQQDSAPCHVSHRAMAWIEEHAYDCVTKDMWPPSSPDLNPMDYFVWGYLESRVNRRPHTTKASLIASIKEQFASMPSTLVKRACGRFRTRITAVIEAEGNYIERS